MKIVTLAPSPYLLTSGGQLNASIIKHLLFNNYPVASIVWGHDTNYFVPEQDENGKNLFYYTFNKGSDEYKIPLIPFRKHYNESVIIYEILNVLKPDIILTIGDLNDFTFMRAVKMFYNNTTSLKWVHVGANCGFPFNENNVELIDDMDAILCTSKTSLNAFKEHFKKETIDMEYVGSSLPLQKRSPNSELSAIVCAKNILTDNLPMAMAASCQYSKTHKNIKLNVHSNVFEHGEYDLNLLKSRFDPKDETIQFPEKYVSTYEGLSDGDMAREYSSSSIFIAPSMISSTAMSMFDAISQGCVPLATDVGCQSEIAEKLTHYLGIQDDAFTIPCTKLMTSGETYLSVCNPEDLVPKIIFAANKGIIHQNAIAEFGKKFSRKGFLNKLCELIQLTKELHPSLSLDAVT